MNTTDTKEFNEHIKSMGSDIDIEKMKNSRFTINGEMVPDMTWDKMWEIIKETPKYFEKGDRLMHKNRFGKEKICRVTKVYFMPIFDSWLYEYVYDHENDDALPGIMTNNTVETLKLEKMV